jgi:hypothetical protein
MNEEKASEALEELLNVFQKYHLNPEEIVLVMSNLLYSLGASVEGHDDQGPSVTEVMEAYYTNPTVGNALMAQGLLMNQEWMSVFKKATEEEDV